MSLFFQLLILDSFEIATRLNTVVLSHVSRRRKQHADSRLPVIEVMTFVTPTEARSDLPTYQSEEEDGRQIAVVPDENVTKWPSGITNTGQALV